MSVLAANSAGFSDLSPYFVERALAGQSTGNGIGRLRLSCGRHTSSFRAAISAIFCSECADDGFAPAGVFHYVSRPLLSHCFGVFPAPGGTRSSASHSAPLRGLSSSQKKSANLGRNRRANFFRAPPRKQTFGTWEPGPLAKLRPV